MKSFKRDLILFSLFVLVFSLFVVKVNAVTLPWFTVSANNYSRGDKIEFKDLEVLKTGESMQLYGMIVYGNDIVIPELPDGGLGIFVANADLSDITWESEDDSIATVDASGKVTGVGIGKVDILARYYYEDAKEEQTNVTTIQVIDNSLWKEASDWAIVELAKASSKELFTTRLTNADLTKNITREEFAEVAVKMYERITGEIATPAQNLFTDTTNVEILKAYSLGITTGTTETTFTPNAEITREQMATMLARGLKRAGIDTTPPKTVVQFADDYQFSDYARDSIYFMSNEGIIKGMGDNKFGPEGTATREQALVMVLRICENIEEKFLYELNEQVRISFDERMKEFKNSDNKAEKIYDYVLEDIGIFSKEEIKKIVKDMPEYEKYLSNNHYLLNLTYAVKPENLNAWTAGTGEIREDWVIGKTEYYSLDKVNDVYVLTQIGTGL